MVIELLPWPPTWRELAFVQAGFLSTRTGFTQRHDHSSFGKYAASITEQFQCQFRELSIDGPVQP